MTCKIKICDFISDQVKLCAGGLFADGILKVKDVHFGIHKVILSNCSPFFKALFSWYLSPEKTLFEIPDLSPKIMKLIIGFAYTGKIPVTVDNVQDLLLAADKLLINAIVDACCKFLEKELCLENCIGIWKLTKFLMCPQLQLKAYQFILNKFQQVLCTNEFWQLSLMELCGILERDELKVRRESIVFDAIQRWISYAPESRQKYFSLLLSKVRLALMSPEYIILNVMSNELVRSSPECLQKAKNALGIKTWMNEHNLSALSNLIGRPRLPEAILLAFGGEAGSEPTNCIEVYDVQSDHWFNVTENQELPRAHHGVVYLNGYVYCIGGTNHVEHFNRVHKFDPCGGTWHEAAPMYFRRSYVSVTVANGYIYAIGGYNGFYRHSSAERYKPKTNQWRIVQPMMEARSHASCTTLDNKIYVCGGFNGNDIIRDCEYYCPESDQWTSFTPMISVRSGMGVIAYANHVYAIGGFDGSTRLQSVEAYDPVLNIWHRVPSMLNCRSNFGVGVIDDRLFVIGGFNGYDAISDVENYDLSTNEWSVSCSLEFRRSAVGCCLLYGLPNVHEYIIPRDNLPCLLDEDEIESDVLEQAQLMPSSSLERL